MADHNEPGWANPVRQTRWELSCVGEEWKTCLWSIIFINQHTHHQCCVSKCEWDWYSTHTLLLVFIELYSVNGRVNHFPIYKKGNYYDEQFPSIESAISHYSRTGFLSEDNINVKLTNQLIPDKWAISSVVVCVCVCARVCVCVCVCVGGYLESRTRTADVDVDKNPSWVVSCGCSQPVLPLCISLITMPLMHAVELRWSCFFWEVSLLMHEFLNFFACSISLSPLQF